MRNPNFRPVVLSCVVATVLIAAPSAYGDPAVASTGTTNNTVGELSRLQDRLTEAEAQNKASAELPSKRAHALRENRNPQPAQPLDLPVVVLVSGIGEKLQAVLSFPNGSSVEVSQGELIPGGFQVESVSVERITLSRGKERYPLTFAAATPINAQGNTSGQTTHSANGLPFRQVPTDLLPGVPFKVPTMSPDQGARNGSR